MKTTNIFARKLYDGRGLQENVIVEIEAERITGVRPGTEDEADVAGVVTPAFIDGHSHIGMVRQGEPEGESDVNDQIDQITPLNDPLNAIYWDDRGLKEAVDFGVLYACVVPGSGNLLGGRARVIRHFAANREDALFKDYGYKMALGYNPKSTKGWKGTRPTTRMGAYSHLEKRFDEVLQKEGKARAALEKKLAEAGDGADAEAKRDFAQREYDLELTSEEKALMEILSGKKTVKCHAHKEDDLLYLIHLKKKYGIRFSAEHTCDVHHVEIFNRLAEEGIPVVYGPLGSLDYKVELKNASYRHTRVIMDSEVMFGLMTDHPVILSPALRDSLKYFLIAGMSDVDAVNLITRRNAEILGIDDELGTVEDGKLASLVVWNAEPLTLGAFPKAVYAEGRRIRG
jgi:imidazolonepropionase-like amidohydrolase